MNKEFIKLLKENNIAYEITSDGLIVKGNLYLRGCTGLKSLPDNLQVGVSLSLNNCIGLTSLPDNLKVNGILYLQGCTLYPFDESKFMIIGEYKIIPNSYRFITETDL